MTIPALSQDFVVEKWDEVSASAEFEQCCKEVAAGEYVMAIASPYPRKASLLILDFRWGPAGGTTLMSVFRRLRSPATTA